MLKKYLMFLIVLNLKQLYNLVRYRKKSESPIWLSMIVFLIASNVRFVQICCGIIIFPLILFLMILELILNKEFRFERLMRMPKDYDVRLIGILKIVLCFTITESGIRIYLILKKIFMGGRTPINFNQIVFNLILGSPLWFLNLVEEISIELYKDINTNLSSKKISSRFSIRIWRFKNSIRLILYERLKLRYNLLKSFKIYWLNGKLNFNPSSKGKKLYNLLVREDHLIKSGAFRSEVFNNIVKRHPIIYKGNIWGNGLPITHTPKLEQRGLLVKFSHDNTPNFIIYNDLQKKDIMCDSIVESFKANKDEIDLSYKFACHERFTKDENIHINAFRNDRRMVLDKSYKNVKEGDLKNFNFDKELIDKILKDIGDYPDYNHYEIDYIDNFKAKNSYDANLKSKLNSNKSRVLDIEKISQYDFDEKDNLYDICRKINIQQELLQLWEISDLERDQILDRMLENEITNKDYKTDKIDPN